MKHTIGYGVLLVALGGSVAYGIREHKKAEVRPGPTISNSLMGGGEHSGNFTFPLVDKHEDAQDVTKRRLTDHVSVLSPEVSTISWTLDLPFHISFDDGQPCVDGAGHNVASIDSIPSSDGSTNVAVCTIQKEPDTNMAPLPGPFKYHVKIQSKGIDGKLLNTIPTCDGCLVEFDTGKF